MPTTLTYGDIPADLEITEPYSMELNAADETIVCAAINQGIDAHLEAVFFDDHGTRDGKRCLDIRDSKSMRCLLRRLCESDDIGERGNDLASCIMTTLGFEWV